MARRAGFHADEWWDCVVEAAFEWAQAGRLPPPAPGRRNAEHAPSEISPKADSGCAVPEREERSAGLQTRRSGSEPEPHNRAGSETGAPVRGAARQPKSGR